MAVNVTCNNFSVIPWRSVSLVDETGVPGENHQPFVSHRQTLSHNVVSSISRHDRVGSHNFSYLRICMTIQIPIS
jgi:hypothetical protein